MIVYSRRLSVALLFRVCTLALFAAVGAAVDYSRAASVRTQMQAAIDAAAIMLAKEAAGSPRAAHGKSADILPDQLQGPAGKKMVRPDVHQRGRHEQDQAGHGLARHHDLSHLWQDADGPATDTEVVWGMRRLELALALDNTGSMLQSGKLAALQPHAQSDRHAEEASKRRTTSASPSFRSRPSSTSMRRRTRRPTGSTSPAGPSLTASGWKPVFLPTG